MVAAYAEIGVPHLHAASVRNPICAHWRQSQFARNALIYHEQKPDNRRRQSWQLLQPKVDMAVREQGITRSQFLRQSIERNLRHYERCERAVFARIYQQGMI
jgi:hypothetical protein